MGKKLFGGASNGRYANNEPVSIMDEPEESPRRQNREDRPARTEAAQKQERPEKTKAQRAAKAEPAEPGKKTKKSPKPHKGLRVAAWLLSILLFLESAYCVVIFTDLIPPLSALRSIYIDTAMVTMTHQYLATALIPGDIVMDVVHKTQQAKEEQQGVVSGWEDLPPVTEPEEIKSPSSGFSKEAAATMLNQLAQDLGLSSGEDEFFELFHELDEASVHAYVEDHPEVISAGWDKFEVNKAHVGDEGTEMMTKQGDQVLAVDAANGLLAIRVKGSTYKGVLILGKDPSRLKCASAASRNVGQRVGEIAQANNALVGMTGSGFEDLPGQAEGSHQTGASMCSGEIRGTHDWGVKRIELHRDNRLYVMDSNSPFGEGCTDATEWTPALIVDGVDVSGRDNQYTAMNPRTCLGQTKDEAIMFLGIEGRKLDSMGCNAAECAKILMRYGGYQAMNVDGGTSAMLWYKGAPVMRCSNADIPEGRRLPNAWVYCAEPVPDPA